MAVQHSEISTVLGRCTYTANPDACPTPTRGDLPENEPPRVYLPLVAR